jgi:hypothetical protein
VIGIPLVEPPEQRDVDGGLHAVCPIVVQNSGKQLAVELVHPVVVLRDLRGE